MGATLPCITGLGPWRLDKITLAFGALFVGLELRLWDGPHPFYAILSWWKLTPQRG